MVIPFLIVPRPIITLYKLLLFFLLICSLEVQAQELEWNINFFAFADNREYSVSDRESPTYMGLQLAPEAGLLMDSTHRIRVGMNLLKEFGTNNFRRIEPTIYYQYQQRAVDFYIGVFPRVGLTDNFSNALLSDTVRYYRPNLNGILFRYKKSHVFQQVWIDWRSKQTEYQREQFIVGVSGKLSRGLFSVEHEAILWHNALPSRNEAGVHVEDNAALKLQLGVDFSSKTALDSLALRAGGLFSFDRDRAIDKWNATKGLIIEADLAYRSFYMKNTLYWGDPQVIALGDDFFSENRYNRLDLGWMPFRGNGLTARLEVSLHFTPGAIDNQQTLILRYPLGATYGLKKERFR